MKLNKNIIKAVVKNTAIRTYSNGIFGYYTICFGSPVVLEESDKSDKELKVLDDGTIWTRRKIYRKGWATFAGKKVSFQFDTKEQAEEALVKLSSNRETIAKMYKEGTLTYEALKAMAA